MRIRLFIFMTVCGILLGACSVRKGGEGTESTAASDPAGSAGETACSTSVPESSTQTTPGERRTSMTADKTSKPATTASSEPGVISERKLSPLPAGQDELLFSNPDRGFRTHLTFYVSEAKEMGVQKYLDWKFGIFYDHLNEPCKLMMVYIYITEFRNMDITKEGMDIIEALLERSRQRGIRLMLRFGYCDDMRFTDRNADEATMIRHIRQLAPLVARNRDVVHSIQDGFIGAYAEWHSQVPAVNKEHVLRNIMEYLVEPNGIYFQARLPEYKNEIPSVDPYYDRIGFHNDAMFGAQTKKDWESGGFQLGTTAWFQVIQEAYKTPQDGEMFVNSNLLQTKRIPTGMEIIRELSQHRHTSMSIWHGYREMAGSDTAVMEGWKKQTVTPETLEDNGIVYCPGWFRDGQGKTVNRSAFEFIRDHLGYRLEAQSVKLTGSKKPGGNARVTLTFKNYGLSAAFHMTSGIAILDSRNNVVAKVKAGKPTDWHSHDPQAYLSTDVLTHTVKADLKLPLKKGSYKVAFYMNNTMGDYARLSNGLEYTGGFNSLCKFEV